MSDVPFERDARIRSVVLAALGFALAARTAQYAARTSIWHDEAFVVLNVIKKGFAELLGPLEFHEAAPPGFLIAEKLAVEAFGRWELSLRLLPLLAGLAGTVGFAFLARRIVGPGWAWLWATLLLGASAKLIVQSNEAKHFTLDLLLAVALTGLALEIRRDPGPLRLLAWGLAGAVGLWLSYASLFVFAGTSLALAPALLLSTDRGAWRAYLLAHLPVIGSAALLLAGPIAAQSTSTILGFWSGSFPLEDGLVLLPLSLGRSLLGFFNYFWQPLGVAVMGLVFLGVRNDLHRGRRFEVALLWLPVALALAASFLRRWPFGGNQHMTFGAVAVCLSTASGLEWLRSRFSQRRPAAATAAVALFLLAGVAPAAWRIVSPRLRHEVRPVIEFVQRQRAPADQLFVFCPAEWEFYTGAPAPPAPPKPDPSRRVWFVGTRSGVKPFPAESLLSELRARRRGLEAVERHGAAAYLFGLESAP